MGALILCMSKVRVIGALHPHDLRMVTVLVDVVTSVEVVVRIIWPKPPISEVAGVYFKVVPEHVSREALSSKSSQGLT